MRTRRYAQGFALGSVATAGALTLASVVSSAILNRRIDHALGDVRSRMAATRMTGAHIIMGRTDLDPATKLELARQLVPDFPDPAQVDQ